MQTGKASEGKHKRRDQGFGRGRSTIGSVRSEPASIHTSSSVDCWERVDSIERVPRSSNRAARLLYRAAKAGGDSKVNSQLFRVRFCAPWRKPPRLPAGCQSRTKQSPTKAHTR